MKNIFINIWTQNLTFWWPFYAPKHQLFGKFWPSNYICFFHRNKLKRFRWFVKSLYNKKKNVWTSYEYFKHQFRQVKDKEFYMKMTGKRNGYPASFHLWRVNCASLWCQFIQRPQHSFLFGSLYNSKMKIQTMTFNQENGE